jgi:hypothetical protein
MPAEERDAVESSSRVLTCQRKSELVLLCACGHYAWEHAGAPDELSVCTEALDDGGGGDDSPWAALLRDANLRHVREALDGRLAVEDAYALLDASRVSLLSELKRVGIDKLSDRQGLCNALGRARRMAALERERSAQAQAGAAPPRWTIKIDGSCVDCVMSASSSEGTRG